MKTPTKKILLNRINGYIDVLKRNNDRADALFILLQIIKPYELFVAPKRGRPKGSKANA